MVLVGHLGEVALALEAAGVLAGAVQAEHERRAPPGAQPLGHVDDDRGRAREHAQAAVAGARDDAHGSPTGPAGRGAGAGVAARTRSPPAPPQPATVSATSTTAAPAHRARRYRARR